ncbi:MAG: hypothetical protein WDW38_004879 [Sanguina aurantia]
MTSHQLQAAAANDSLHARQPEAATYNGQNSAGTFHLFLNETSEDVDLFWFHEKGESLHGSMAPKGNMYIGTHSFHQWKVKSRAGKLLGVHMGASATISIHPSGCLIKFNNLSGPEDESLPVCTAAGRYRERGQALGMSILAYDIVPDEAVWRAAHILTCMFACSPVEVLQQMRQWRAAVGIVARSQVMSDLPPHAFMKYNMGRDLDSTCRGLGATTTIPVTAVGEENLTMVEDRVYPCQSILVHEMGHAVMNLAMSEHQVKQVCALFNEALTSDRYPRDCYMMSNEQEYWATGLCTVMEQMFGDGTWRYPLTCPQPLRMPSTQDRRDRMAEAAVAASARADAALAAREASPGARAAAADAAAAAADWIGALGRKIGLHVQPAGDVEMNRLGSEKSSSSCSSMELPTPFFPRVPPAFTRCLASLAGDCMPQGTNSRRIKVAKIN